MKKYTVLFLLTMGLFFTSCVPTKDLIYLQNKNKSAENNINPVVLKPYRLQTNDVLNITIKAIDPKLVAIFNPTTTENSNPMQGLSEQGLYFNGFTVNDHGNIRIPVIGEINVLGYTLDETRIKIEKELLENYFNKEANVFVSVKLSGLRFTVNGEINSPGTKMLFQEKVNVLEAIANAGDITVIGDRKKVTIIRQFPHGTEMHDIDLTDVNVMQSPYYYLQPNDYIYIKPLPQKSWGTGKTGIESLGTIITLLSLASTTYLLLTR
ncbi:polysaccharide export outer membrane protein [Flavobacterium arsenatis]|uniref:Polysaccharide export outer membrane protein n=1 Tax=Flavobacterium arsenatis TaxID=1484332 RepID=A0ABU1TQL9_9FLAO|nr:polysaccharide biosynthesis/export family protein [Flavobacterium arsenatis]MDR6968275.1 polysaccharide export outer membrane protein [Flavobacterium arsenatis]